MTEKINIAELLENCPKGMELYSPIFGKVYLDKVRPHLEIVVATDKYKEEFLYDGRYGINGECMLFPSKEKTTWEGFAPPGKFKDGDVCYIKTKKFEHIFIFKVNENYNLIQEHAGLCEDHFYTENPVCTIDDVKEHRLATEEEKQKLFDAIKAKGYKWNPETKTLEKLEQTWTIQDAKDGDVLAFDDETIVIFKDLYNNTSFHSYCHIEDGIFTISKEDMPDWWRTKGFYPATEEQCTLLFRKIKEAGYHWNAKTKTLEKLPKPKFKVDDKIKLKSGKIGYIIQVADSYYEIKCKNDICSWNWPIENQDDWELVPNKFDITTLVPFESRVLVRNHESHKWSPAMWGYYDCDAQNYPYIIVGDVARYCIPYEGNEHLLGTTKDCEEYYKIWE